MNAETAPDDNRTKGKRIGFPGLFLPFVFLLFSCGGGGGGGGDLNSPPTVTTLDASSIVFDGAMLNGTVNPNGQATEAWFEYGNDNTLSGGFTTTVRQNAGSGSGEQAVSAAISGLDPDSDYYFRLVAENVEGRREGAILMFTTPPPPPAATTTPAGIILATSATLNGSVNPNGVGTDAVFEWGTSPSLGNTTAPPQPLGSGTSAVPVGASISPLTPGTTYYFRVKATSAGGTGTGSILSFTTLLLPTAATDNALAFAVPISSDPTRATLNGRVNPNGTATTGWFEYGTDSTLTSYSNSSTQDMGSGTTDNTLSRTVTGLLPWRTYYYRAVASSIAGTQKGTIKSFPTGEYYVAVGDSITRGSHDDFPGDDVSNDGRDTGGGYEPILNNLLTAAKGYPHTVKNEGVSGENSTTLLARIDNVIANQPNGKYFLIMCGTNDALFPIPSGKDLDPGNPAIDNTFKGNLSRIIEKITQAGKIPYLAKVPFTTDPLRDNASILEYNEAIDELVTFYFIPVVPPDFYTHFEANPGELDDGIHPNGAGYQSMAALWRNALAP